MFKCFIAAAVVAAALGAPLNWARADMAEGIAAYNDSDYFVALSELKPEAADGNAIAQIYVAGIYHYGLIGPANFAEAEYWYRLAVNQNNVDGALGLAVMYSLGQGVAKDEIEAYKWMRIAQQGLPAGSTDRGRVVAAIDALAQSLTSTQIAEAEQRAANWQPGQEVIVEPPASGGQPAVTKTGQ